MPYGLGAVIVGLSLLIVFVTFLYLMINARGLMALFKPVSDGEIKVGPGRRSSKRGAAIALILHFVAWGIAGLAYAYLLADVRATGPDTTPLESIGIVDGER